MRASTECVNEGVSTRLEKDVLQGRDAPVAQANAMDPYVRLKSPAERPDAESVLFISASCKD